MNKSIYCLLAVLGAFAGRVEAAETMAIGSQGEATLTIAEGVRTTLASNVLMGAGARLLKTGAGTLVLPPAKFP